MITLVLIYYFCPPARGWFQELAWAKARWGYGFSLCSSVIAGAVLPMVLKVVTIQRGKLKAGDWAEFLFLCIFWGLDGVIIDAFYRLQAVIFGGNADFLVVFKKVLVDQFIYNPLFAAPFTIAAFEFRNQQFSLRKARHVFTLEFYRVQVIPALFATWGVWIPVTSAIYALPSLLQIPLFALALTFWSLLITYLTAQAPAGVEAVSPLITGDV